MSDATERIRAIIADAKVIESDGDQGDDVVQACALNIQRNAGLVLAAAEERDRLKEERDHLLVVLEALVEVQNGPPLLKYEAEWNSAMDKAHAALNGPRP